MTVGAMTRAVTPGSMCEIVSGGVVPGRAAKLVVAAWPVHRIVTMPVPIPVKAEVMAPVPVPAEGASFSVAQ
jgi:hypothetical protein